MMELIALAERCEVRRGVGQESSEQFQEGSQSHTAPGRRDPKPCLGFTWLGGVVKQRRREEEACVGRTV